MKFSLKVARISDIYEWSVNILAPNLSQSQVNLISDNSSILLGNAIIKQKRIKKGNHSIDNIYTVEVPFLAREREETYRNVT